MGSTACCSIVRCSVPPFRIQPTMQAERPYCQNALINITVKISLQPGLQEENQLKSAVERIATFEPDILLVEKSVGRFAQEELLERGIALVLNVKRSVLDRLGRCTGAKVPLMLARRACPGFTS